MKALVQQIHGKSGKAILQAQVPFMELYYKAFFTKKTTAAQNIAKDEASEVDENTKYYQRKLDPRRLAEIQNYIYNSVIDELENISVSALFPTSMILAVENDEFSIEETDEIVDFDFGSKAYIVDGQHRMMAMKMLYEKLSSDCLPFPQDSRVLDFIKSYKFNCTILVNYDLWEQGQVFVNVNFKHKPVNKSLYYEIFGSEYRENPNDWTRNYIYLAHCLTQFMNDTEDSPFFGKIKMLGTGDGYVSQAFFVESLLRHLKPGGIWRFDPEDSSFDDQKLAYMGVELLTYYHAVSEVFGKHWGYDEKGKLNVICKTTGVGAFIRLLADIHSNLSDEVLVALHLSPAGVICKSLETEVTRLLQPLAKDQDRLFGEDSIYRGTGGGGLEVKLYKDMLAVLLMNKMIQDNPISRMTSEERVKAIARLQNTKLILQLRRLGITDVDADLNAYMIANMPSGVDMTCNHVSDVEATSIVLTDIESLDGQGQLVKGECAVEGNGFLDSEEDVKFKFYFPATFKLTYKQDETGWKVDDSRCETIVDSPSYFK